MTNAEIIEKQARKLMEQGILKVAYQQDATDENGNAVKVDMPEALNTFAAWKSLGFKVRKGEHAVAKFGIWKYNTKKNEDGEDESYMFYKTAAFFSASQVEKLAE